MKRRGGGKGGERKKENLKKVESGREKLGGEEN